jgi:hypothetical protein
LATSESSPGASEAEGQFRQLPSVKLFTDQIEQARAELVVRWDGYGGEDEFPLLWQLSTTAKAQARQTLRDNDQETNAAELLARWAVLDSRFGNPLERGWVMTSREAAERFEVLTEYLHSAGELSVLKVERDAPEEFLSKKEQEGV